MTRFDGDDERLAERFAAWRKAEEGRVPRLDRMLAPKRRPAMRPWRVAALAFGTVALAALVIMASRTTAPDVSPGEFAVSMMSLRGPTDFLLDQAAGPRAGAIPAIGSVDWYPLASRTGSLTHAPRRRN